MSSLKSRRGLWSALRSLLEPALLVTTLGLLAAGGVAWAAGAAGTADALWAAATVVAIIPAVGWVIAALRHRTLGADVIAVLALVGTLAVGEYLAGALIAVMLATGRALDAAAQRRATRDLRALLERAPRTARRRVGDQSLEVAVDEVVVGDVVEIAPGEVLPVDGLVLVGPAVLDESALTGEPELAEHAAGDAVRSGTLNAGGAVEVRCTVPASQSTYAGIIALVRQAGAENAPVIRLADRFATGFLPLSLTLAALAWWASGSAERAVAVLVVATPCPLLLAAPVAIVSGLSRASRRGVVIRSGGALENLGRARTMVLDKTGTLTAGQPAVVEVLTAPDWSATDVLRLAASADQLSLTCSPRPWWPRPACGASRYRYRARSPRSRAAVSPPPLTGSACASGSATVRRRRHGRGARSAGRDSTVARWCGSRPPVSRCGAVLLKDPLRADSTRTLRRLRSAGIERLVMLDRGPPEPAREVGAVLGLSEVRAGQTPASKVTAVRGEQQRAVTVMVGDGLNDAPALAAATVGVAMGARGATALVGGRRRGAHHRSAGPPRRCDGDRPAVPLDCRQSAVAGMVMSLAADGTGRLRAVGAGVRGVTPGGHRRRGHPQRAAGAARRRGRRPAVRTGDRQALLRRFAAEHEELRQVLPLVRDAAEVLAGGPTPRAVEALHRAQRALDQQLLPHEQAEEAELYPALARTLGSPTKRSRPMSRAHAEIGRLTRRLHSHLDALDAGSELDPERRQDLMACLFTLSGLLQLHYLQEEENYFALVDQSASLGSRERSGRPTS